jgi:hypothetical protein
MQMILLGLQTGDPSLVVDATFGADTEFFFNQISSFFKPPSAKKPSS